MAKSQFTAIYQGVPAFLRGLREQAGLTQRALATRIGKSQSWIHKSEIGSRRVDIGEFLEWCHGCGIDPQAGFRRLCEQRGQRR